MTPTTPQALAQVLTDSLGRRVDVAAVPTSTVKRGERTVCAAFRADDQSLASVCVCDLASVIYSGAALSLYPNQRAKEDILAGRVDSNLAENFAEILNICSGWVGAVLKRHVKYEALYVEEAKRPAEVQTMSLSTVHRMHLQWNIAGYGPCRMTLVY